eukprot:TRINITY_DN15813_c0_g1_i1.p1 TRINITY_DN15813_c0_g1~~TRINITY_DN15813_c0_g1_i1.p1  ORF type:complete len:487 (+),score=56.25 TRINITY_DN15813_c0_g1_i1:65-1525(+)
MCIRDSPCILVLLLGLAAIWLASVFRGQRTSSPSQEDLKTIQYLATNIQTSPLVSIHISTECKSGFEAKTIGRFDGLHAGCACGESSIRGEQNCRSECPHVEAKEGHDIYLWGRGNKICLRRAPIIRFIEAGGVCPQFTRLCGQTACVPQGDECPIVDIQVLRALPGAGLPLIPSDYTTERDTSTFIGLDGEEKLVIFKRSFGPNDEDFITDLILSVGGVPCASLALLPSRPSGKSYPLEVAERRGCGTDGVDNKFSSKIDFQGELLTLEANFIEIPQNFAIFLQKNREIVSLVQRMRIRTQGLTYCQALSSKSDEQRQSGENLEQACLSLRVYLIVADAILVIAMIFQVILLFMRRLNLTLMMAICISLLIATVAIVLLIAGFKLSSAVDSAQAYAITLEKCVPASPFARVLSEAATRLRSHVKELDTKGKLLRAIGFASLLFVILYILLIIRANSIARKNVQLLRNIELTSPTASAARASFRPF